MTNQYVIEPRAIASWSVRILGKVLHYISKRCFRTVYPVIITLLKYHLNGLYWLVFIFDISLSDNVSSFISGQRWCQISVHETKVKVRSPSTSILFPGWDSKDKCLHLSIKKLLLVFSLKLIIATQCLLSVIVRGADKILLRNVLVSSDERENRQRNIQNV